MLFIGDVECGVSRRLSVSITDLRSRKRTARVAMARQVVMYLAYELMHESYPAIGRMMGRDHATIIHGHEVTKGRMLDNREFRKLVESISLTITAGTDTEEWHWERRINRACAA
jgi:chromosomal replication initiator protein